MVGRIIEQVLLGKKYYHFSKRMKNQKALLVITRKILVIIFNVLKTKQPFDFIVMNILLKEGMSCIR
jgi:hypothetical protein